MKKFFAMLLGLSVLLGISTGVFALEESETHTDNVKNIVSDSFTYINPIYRGYVREKDLVDSEDIDKNGRTYSSEEEYIISVEEVGKLMREQLKSRVNPVTVYYAAEEYDKSLFYDLMEEAVRHTGKPDEGAYIEYNSVGWKGSVEYYVSDGSCYMTFTFYVSYCTTAEQEAEVDEAVASLLKNLDLEGRSQYEKVCAIYDYICDNVDYDYKNLFDEDYILKFSTYAALINKTAVCQGYATLFYRLAMECGIDARVISGVETVNGGNHGWNIVRLANRYYNLDATWDAGSIYYDYFLECDDNFEYHKRDYEFRTDEFYAECEMSEKDYGYSGEEKIIAAGWCGAEDELGKNLEWILYSEGGLEITGTGKMKSCSGEDFVPWHEYADKITSLSLAGEITDIGGYAFADCVSLGGEFSVSANIKSIGEKAFYNCGINDFYFEGDAPVVGSLAFDADSDVIHYNPETSGWEVDENGNWNGFKAVSEGEMILYGDINGDRKVNVLDANIARRCAVKLIILNESQFAAADVDGNGKVNVADASLIRRYAVKLVSAFPVEE